jgi:hypothetical protein
MEKFWIAVASADHVKRGFEGSFMQVCHGKAAPLQRLRPGDGVVYYSPTKAFKGKDKLQAFTALGLVRQRVPYRFEMDGGFCPFRRDVAWLSNRETPIQPLLTQLSFSANNSHWGYQLRFGLFEITAADFDTIAAAMAVAPSFALCRDPRNCKQEALGGR